MHTRAVYRNFSQGANFEEWTKEGRSLCKVLYTQDNLHKKQSRNPLAILLDSPLRVLCDRYTHVQSYANLVLFPSLPRASACDVLHIQHTWPLSSLQLYWPQSCTVCTRADCCLQHTKFTPDPGTSAGGEGQVYEQVDEVTR